MLPMEVAAVQKILVMAAVVALTRLAQESRGLRLRLKIIKKRFKVNLPKSEKRSMDCETSWTPKQGT